MQNPYSHIALPFSEKVFHRLADAVLRHPCPFPSFRADPPPWRALHGGVNFFFRCNCVTSCKFKKLYRKVLEYVCRSSKTFYECRIHFFKDFEFFLSWKIPIFEGNWRFWLFDTLHFLRVKSGEKDKNVSKRMSVPKCRNSTFEPSFFAAAVLRHFCPFPQISLLRNARCRKVKIFHFPQK